MRNRTIVVGQPCGCLEAQTIVRILQQKKTCRETGASFTKLTYD